MYTSLRPRPGDLCGWKWARTATSVKRSSGGGLVAPLALTSSSSTVSGDGGGRKIVSLGFSPDSCAGEEVQWFGEIGQVTEYFVRARLSHSFPICRGLHSPLLSWVSATPSWPAAVLSVG